MKKNVSVMQRTRRCLRALFCASAMLAALLGGPALRADENARLHVWNLDPLALERGEVPDSLPPDPGPVMLAAPRNGRASGKVMVGGTGHLQGVGASVGDLEGEHGTIPSERAEIYYGVPWRDMSRGWLRPHGFDILLDNAPDDSHFVAIWCTVQVPRDAAPGRYIGSLTVEAGGEVLARVPIALLVADWTLPEPEGFHAWNDLVQSPDTLAKEYGLELRSDEHWALVARTFGLSRPLADRTLYVPLICNTNLGNEQSMVRWIPDGEGGYSFDFTVLERYLDVAQENSLRPSAVVFNVWDVYQSSAEDRWTDEWWEGLTPRQRENSYFIELYERGRLLRELQGEHGMGPVVSVDHDGELTAAPMPPYTGQEYKAHWSRLFEQLRRRMADRGLEDAMMLGMLTDSWPTAEEVEALAEISGGLPWASHAHWSAYRRRGGTVRGAAGIGFESIVWDLDYRNPADPDRMFGWRREQISLAHYRMRGFNGFYPGRMRTVMEMNLSGNQRGIGRVGMDFWWVLRDSRGRRSGTISNLYPQSLWRNLDIQASILAPGPDGPQPTSRYFYLLEGMQEAEARVVIEKALLDREAELDEEVISRAWELLDARQRAAWRCAGRDEAFMEEEGHADLPPHQKDGVGHEWFVQSGWFDRTVQLYDLAGEVARALNGN